MQTVKILFQILIIMYWIVIGLSVSFKIYTPLYSSSFYHGGSLNNFINVQKRTNYKGAYTPLSMTEMFSKE